MTRNGPTGPARDTGRTRIDSEARSGEGPKGDKGFNGEAAVGGRQHLQGYPDLRKIRFYIQVFSIYRLGGRLR